MAKTKTKRTVARATSDTLAYARKTSGRRAVQKRQQSSGLAAFVREFPWLTGILSVAIVAGLVSLLYTNHVGPFAVKPTPDPCAWAFHPDKVPAAPKTIVRTYSAPPPACITGTTGGAYVATIHTARGDVNMVLDQSVAPATVNNFIFLATHHYYDGLSFNRIDTKPPVVQGGDPRTASNPTLPYTTAAQGTEDGPGYVIPDEFPKSATAYTAGTVEMANKGAGTTGSIFFISTGSNIDLPATYNYFGSLLPGSLDIVKQLRAGDVITSVTVILDPSQLPGVPPGVKATPATTPAASPTPTK